MTSEAQRIAIAEACGWTRIVHRPYIATVNEVGPTNGWFGCKPGMMSSQLPDYLSDLNAIREARTAIFGRQKGYYERSFVSFLRGVLGSTQDGMLDKREVYDLLCATPAQEAEALLRTLGKWVDAPSKEKEK